MKIKTLLIISLLLGAMSCSTDEPDIDIDPTRNPWLNSMIPDGNTARIQTPKGWVTVNKVKKEDLPGWLQGMTQEIRRGYIMKAGSGDDLLYFVYDTYNDYGRHYNAQGNPTKDNPNLKDWVIIYVWYA